MKIIGTGLSGLVGSRIIELLTPEFTFENLSLETGIDITDNRVLTEKISQSDASWVFHFAAKTDVESCENDKVLGEKGLAWILNANTTKNLADICQTTQKKLLYISTDMVFDGTKDTYDESDAPNPLSWYGYTKYAGEKHVQILNESGLIVRIANPYRIRGPGKPDFVHKILDRLDGGLPVTAPADQIFTPTYIDDIAMGIKYLVKNNISGIYHLVGDDSMSPYAAALEIADVFSKDRRNISPATMAEYFKNRAPRPLHASLKNVKIKNCGIDMSPFQNGLKKIKLLEGA
jgi:dTDP-4-dehydrorhamnose reductase